MNQTKSLQNFSDESSHEQNSVNDLNYGVTKRLLKKYKLSSGFVPASNKYQTDSEPRVA